MASGVQSLWPDAIRASVQSPLSVLNRQAEALTEQTKGVLVGKVESQYAGDDRRTITFDMIAPELEHFRQRVMVVAHGQESYYPAVIDADVFRESGMASLTATMAQLMNGGPEKKPKNRADNDDEFVELVAKVLRSPYIVSVAQSLIARVGDLREKRERDKEGGPSQSP